MDPAGITDPRNGHVLSLTYGSGKGDFKIPSYMKALTLSS
jgi:hypothetical protein